MAAGPGRRTRQSAELSDDVPQTDDPDLELFTVPAVMAWVNQKTGPERAERLARVMAIVRPDGPTAG